MECSFAVQKSTPLTDEVCAFHRRILWGCRACACHNFTCSKPEGRRGTRNSTLGLSQSTLFSLAFKDRIYEISSCHNKLFFIYCASRHAMPYCTQLKFVRAKPFATTTLLVQTKLEPRIFPAVNLIPKLSPLSFQPDKKRSKAMSHGKHRTSYFRAKFRPHPSFQTKNSRHFRFSTNFRCSATY